MEIILEYTSTGDKGQKRIWLGNNLIGSIYYRNNSYKVQLREISNKDLEFPTIDKDDIKIKKEIDKIIREDANIFVNSLLSDNKKIEEITNINELSKIKLDYKQLKNNKGYFDEKYIGVYMGGIHLATINYSDIEGNYMLHIHTLPPETGIIYFPKSKLGDINTKKQCVKLCENEAMGLFITFLKPSKLENKEISNPPSSYIQKSNLTKLK